MKHRLLLMALVLNLVWTSCNDYLDINQNPNVATEAPLDGLVQRITYQTPHNVYRIATSYTNYYVQYFASPNEASPTDTYDRVDFSNRWADLYDVMTDAYDLIKFSREIHATNHEAIGRILMAVNLAMATDSWGSVPYSSGFSGKVIQVPYDSEEQIYRTIFDHIDEAILLLQSPGDAPVPASEKELIYGGELEKWLQLAYGLKARYLNRFSGTSNEEVGMVLSAVENGLKGNPDDAQLTFFNVRNPWAQVAINNDALLLDGWISAQFANAMNGTLYGVLDPRLPLITEPFEENGEWVYQGTVNGAGRRGDGTVPREIYLETSGYYSREHAPLFLFTYAEQKFIESEAAFRGGDMERAIRAFEAGIRANMEKIGVEQGDLDQYLNEKFPNLVDGVLTLQEIMDEKYLAMFLQPETWNDARRFDYQYTGFQLPEHANLGDFIRRLEYPDSEKSRNGINVPAIDGLTDRLYWDE